jgi:hypothetical protein
VAFLHYQGGTEQQMEDLICWGVLILCGHQQII